MPATTLSRTGRGPRLAALVAVLLFPAPAFAQPVTASVTTHPSPLPPVLKLSDTVRVTLAFEGPAPLRVELPQPVLAPEADRDWRVRPAGPPAVTPLDKGRERWAQPFDLDPYAPGEAYVAFAPVQVNGKPVAPGGFVVRVAPPADPKPRPATGIEELPPPPVDTAAAIPPWAWAAGGAGVAAVVVLVVAWRARRKPPPVPPEVWAAGAFDRLEKGGVAGVALADGVAAAVRGFIDRRFGIPAPKLTTAELLAAAEAAGWAVEQTNSLRGLLADCDRARFAGDVPDDDGCRGLLARGRNWVNQVSAGRAGPG